ncbi:MAG TPA: DEAD/DEAH box helicase [Candidatus Nanoarchaeia archaeon]|nr:DEAD/DEAH box helicase [Candidatus Nanoarchaeia archaeon]
MVEKFRQLGISEHTLNAIKILGFETPSEIQEKAIPLVLKGKDVIAGASTGSGKTLAFGTGIINNSKPDYGIQGLILVPTRELAEQITKELKKFLGEKKLKIVPIYGGMSMGRQIDELKSAEIVVGTPGRILDHLLRRTLNLEFVKTFVLDEADRMFDMGFKEDVEKIINQCPKKRQTLLFSATISQDIVMLANKYMIDPIEISAEVYVDPLKLSQVYYDISDGLKFSLLKYLLENEKSNSVMVFCNTRRNVDFVANNLKAMGIEALPIHGGYAQEKRNKIMEMFHSKKINILVCTDVAARGLDIKEVSHVYNYDIPREHKEYIHRIGRTARAGEKGKVINIITGRDYDGFASVLKHYPDFKIKPEETPRIPRIMLKWMPEQRGRTNNRMSGQGGRFGRGNIRRDNKNFGRSEGRRPDNKRSYSNRRYDNKRNDRRPNYRDGRPSYRDRRPSSGGRRPDNRRSEGRRDSRR